MTRIMGSLPSSRASHPGCENWSAFELHQVRYCGLFTLTGSQKCRDYCFLMAPAAESYCCIGKWEGGASIPQSRGQRSHDAASRRVASQPPRNIRISVFCYRESLTTR
ncbi:hypothetical protein JMJ77_0004308, partial [Colletotrichum scovillei]